jgi:hypothetical protein
MSIFALIFITIFSIVFISPIDSKSHFGARGFEINSLKSTHLSPVDMSVVDKLRAGAVPVKANAVIEKKTSIRKTVTKNLLATWGVVQVVSILANAVKRLLPVAIEPIVKKDLLPSQITLLVAWSAYMIYAEGYKAFQLKFCPLVVKRAFGLSENPGVLKCLLAGPYSMGLFGATRKRMIVSWSITVGVFALVKVVKKLPYPWRAITDAGVVLGLTYGTLSLCWQTVRALFGHMPDCDECLPGSDKALEKKTK